MDSLTHLVAGALTPLAFRGAPRRTAVVVFGICAGELPDIDVLFGGSIEALLTLHRGVTHALFSQPALVLLVVLPFYLWLRCRPVPPGQAASGDFSLGRMYLAALLAVATHIYLDSMTTFGTQVLLPFSGIRLGFPAMFIVDPLLTLPILALLILALLILALRLPPEKASACRPAERRTAQAPPSSCLPPSVAALSSSRESGAALYPAGARRLARAGLAYIALYPLACLGVNAAATALLEPSLTAPPAFSSPGDEGDAAPRFARSRLHLLTEPFSPFVWKAVVDDGASYRVSTVFLLNPGGTRLVESFAKPEPAIYEQLKKEQPLFAKFEDFSPLMVQTIRPVDPSLLAEYGDEAFECAFVDVRYLISPESPARWVGRGDPNFVLEARVNSRGNLLAYRLLQRGIDTGKSWIPAR